jgi:hypothetical protein
MNPNERPTPMTNMEAETDYLTNGEAYVGMRNFARRLEWMCEELAEALKFHVDESEAQICSAIENYKRLKKEMGV